jgi:inner membrane protein involved in colicin E2 resistance
LIATHILTICWQIVTERKTWRDPGSETPSAWLGFIVAITFSILALETYTLLTATYLVAIGLANVLVLILALRTPYGRSE